MEEQQLDVPPDGQPGELEEEPSLLPVTLYKLGGSLLTLHDLPARLRQLLSETPGERPLLLAGGGPVANLVRGWHVAHDLPEPVGHDLALGAMGLNRELLQRLLPETRVVSDRESAESAWGAGHWPVLDARAFLATEEPRQALSLPHTWSATSDAIAAWVTLAWPAETLVLLKSADLPDGASAEETRALGLVDACLAEWHERLPSIAWVNLRGVTLQRQGWPG